MRHRFTALPLIAACGDSVQTVDNPGGGPGDQVLDETPPVIEHEPITESQPFLEGVLIEAIVTDEESGVFVVEVAYRREDSTVWESKALALANPETGLYSGEIPGSDVMSAGMNYYLFAMDRDGNEAYDPEDGESDAWHFRIDGG